MNHPRRIAVFIGAMMLAAFSASAYAGFMSHSWHSYLALAVLALATVTSRMKVKLPGITGNMSVNLPFLLIAVVSLSAAEAIFIAGVSTVAQCWPAKNGKVKAQQMAFNLSMMVFATCQASLMFQAEWLHRVHWSSSTLGLAIATAALFLGQTMPVATIVALSEAKTARQTWWHLAQLSFPYYVVSAGVTSMMQSVSSHMGWALALAVFPVMYGVHRSYRMYFARIAETLRPPVLVRAAGAGSY